MHPQIATHSISKLKLHQKAFFIPFFVILYLCLNTSAKAQTDLEVGLFIGDSYYLGDLNPDVHFKMAQLAYGAILRYNIDDRWAVKLGITRGTVKGSSEKTGFLPGRGLSFESPITDFSVVGEFNFFPYFTGSRWNWITPYLYAGIGWFMFQPTSGGVKLQPLGTEGQNIGYEGRKPYSTNGINIPFGLGVKVSIGRKIGLTAFWELHKTFTDYIDDVSSTFYLDGPAIDPKDAGSFLSDPNRNHQPGMQRGNPKSNDWYSFSGVTVTYKFTLRGTRKCRDTKHF